ncbi:MAG TPA: PQQ-binding-like beta-propeller repeat protein [Natronosporangium sp.]
MTPPAPPAGTIDLGELPSRWAPGSEPALPPARRWRWRWGDRQTWRLTAAVAAGVLVLTTTVAADAEPPAPLTLALTVRAADYHAVADEHRLYVFDELGDNRAVVAAYRLADGALAWRTTVAGTGVDLTRYGDTLLVMAYQPSPDASLPSDDVVAALDAATGRVRWTRRGWPLGQPGDRTDRVLIHQQVIVDRLEPAHSNLTMVDLATGADLWGIVTLWWQHDPASARLVTLAGENTLISFDLVTGERLAEATVGTPTDLTDPAELGHNLLNVVGSLVLVAEEVDGEPTLSAYDSTTLEWRWSIPSPERTYGLSPWPVSCGELLCLLAPVEPPRGVDPATGRVVWIADWLSEVSPDTGYHIFTPISQDLTGYGVLLAYSSARDEQRGWLVDLATGDPVLELGRWEPRGWYETRPGAVTATLIWASETGTWVGTARPDLSGVDPVGLIEAAALNEYGYGTQCNPVPGHVICVTDIATGDPASGTTVEVWRLP